MDLSHVGESGHAVLSDSSAQFLGIDPGQTSLATQNRWCASMTQRSHRRKKIKPTTEWAGSSREAPYKIRRDCHGVLPSMSKERRMSVRCNPMRVARNAAMHNPFTEVVDESTDTDLIEQAKRGSREALEKLVLRHQTWIYNIAVRMVFHLQDAEEVTQEVLIKVITRLSTFQGESRFRTWLYRITANHVLNMKRRGGETETQTFSSYADAINGTPDLDLPDPKSVPVAVPLLVEEAKISCTTGMLLCLDRKQRLIFMLGEVFGASDTVGSQILEMSPDNFRQSLSRARRDLYQFMHGQCGLVNANNPCRCPKKTKGFIEAGHVDPNRLQFVPLHLRRITEAAEVVVRTIENSVDEQYAAIFRGHPLLEPTDQIVWLRKLLDRGDFGKTLHLN
jgi:RNA polymerase sigma factor (sigma-70 family)